jgi:YHS domain-containing protein
MSTKTCTVCGGGLHPAEELTSTHDGKIYWFCSDEHLKEFNATPIEFVS